MSKPITVSPHVDFMAPVTKTMVNNGKTQAPEFKTALQKHMGRYIDAMSMFSTTTTTIFGPHTE